MISPDRNDPETVSWLDLCRHWRPELSAEEFEDLIPDFIDLGQRLERVKELKAMH